LNKDRAILDAKWHDKNNYHHFLIARRGVSYPTFACNIKCCFCYYYCVSKRPHRPLDEMKDELDKFRNEYKLEYVDISGGEPTIYPHINELVEYSAGIGLRPTIITNGQKTDTVRELINNGLEDLLMSIHGSGEDCDIAMNRKGAFKRIQETAAMMNELGFGFRTNTTLISHNYKNLPKLAEQLIEIGPRISNLILFNPHEGTDWSKEGIVDFQVKYSELMPYVTETIDKLMAAGIWVNVRYLPLCQLKGYEKHVCNQHQWQWDPYEWEYLSGFGMDSKQISKIKQTAKKEKLFGATTEDMIHTWITKNKTCAKNIFLDSCDKCANRDICDGIYPQYSRRFGLDEFVPTEGHLISDPLHYRRQDVSWSTMKSKPTSKETK